METISLILPNGINVGGVVYRNIVTRLLDGNDEDLLRDKKFLKEGNVLSKLLRGLIQSIGNISNEGLDEAFNLMPVEDVSFILIKVRENSVGRIYRFESTCPKCEHIENHSIDLSTLVVDEQKDEYRGQSEIAKEIDGVVYVFRQLYIKDMPKIEAVNTLYKNEKGTRELLLQISSINGATPLPSSLKSKSLGHRNKIRNFLDSISGGIDQDLVTECSKCDNVIKHKMPLDLADFFFQAEATVDCPVAIPFRLYGNTSQCLEHNGIGSQEKSEI